MQNKVSLPCSTPVVSWRNAPPACLSPATGASVPGSKVNCRRTQGTQQHTHTQHPRTSPSAYPCCPLAALCMTLLLHTNSASCCHMQQPALHAVAQQAAIEENTQNIKKQGQSSVTHWGHICCWKTTNLPACHTAAGRAVLCANKAAAKPPPKPRPAQATASPTVATAAPHPTAGSPQTATQPNTQASKHWQ